MSKDMTSHILGEPGMLGGKRSGPTTEEVLATLAFSDRDITAVVHIWGYEKLQRYTAFKRSDGAIVLDPNS